MKLAFLMATRGNPKRAAAVIECAKSVASGKHEIQYVVGCDNDDLETIAYFQSHYPELTLSVGDRPAGLGEVWNRCAAVTPADYYCMFSDDVFIGRADWDDYIGVLSMPVLAWNDPANPGQCTQPIVSHRWLELTGKLCDGRFPFWFDDTCVDEIYSFVTGCHVAIPNDLAVIANKGKTKNLRELVFWWEFYAATRAERLSLAAEIRAKLGVDLPQDLIAEVVRMWEQRDKMGLAMARQLELELSSEGSKDPSPQYLAARAYAQNYMDTLKAA